MPIGFKKEPFTLQEKIDEAIRITYNVHSAHDGEFLRGFLIELIEKAYTKINQGNIALGDTSIAGIERTIKELKRNEL